MEEMKKTLKTSSTRFRGQPAASADLPRPSGVAVPLLALLLVLAAGCTLGSRSGSLYVSPTGNDGNDCRSAARPCLHIQAAIDKAVSNDTIHIAAGVYRESIDVSVSVSLLGASSDTTIIDATGPDIALELLPAGGPAAGGLNVLISGLSIRNGLGGNSGGLYVGENAILTMLSSSIQGNTSDGSGAGIANYGDASLLGVTISANTGTDCVGVDNHGTLVIDRGDITGHTLQPGRSAICNSADGRLTLRSTRVHENPGGRAILNDGGIMAIVGTQISGHSVDGDGGAILNRGQLTIGGGSLRGNSATGRGGAIFNVNGLILTNVIIDGNTSNGDGGGINNTAGVIVNGGTISNNRALTTGRGGGIYNEGGVQMSAATLDHNQAVGDGGGIFNLGAVLISASTISRNESIGEAGFFEGNGGGIANEYHGDDLEHYTLTITDSTFSENLARYSGGAIYNICAADISGSTFLRNYASSGGGAIAVEGIPCGGVLGLRLRNSTLSQNSTGIRLGMEFLVENVTVANSGDFGFLFAIGNPLSAPFEQIVRNNILSGNNPNCGGSPVANHPSSGHNLDSDGSCNFFGAGDLSEVDPGLLPLGDYGGPTQTHAVDDTSPAVGRGECTLPTDQRGVARPQPAGGACDIGAYEVIPEAAVPGHAPLVEATPTSGASASPVFTFTQQANCRLGPNTLYESLGFGQVGEQVPILGLSDPAGWYYVQLPTEARCFAAGSTGDVNGSLDGLPVVPAPPLPVATSTPLPPAAPSLSLNNHVCDATQYVVRLGWKDVEGETGYRVYRDGSLIATLGANAILYDDVSPDYNAHAYRVEAFNSAGVSSSVTVSSEGCLY
jgi:hypothetical protein